MLTDKQQYMQSIAKKITELGWIAYINKSSIPVYDSTWILFSKDMNSPFGYIESTMGGFRASIRYESGRGDLFGTGAIFKETPFSPHDINVKLLTDIININNYNWVWRKYGNAALPYTYPLNTIKEELEEKYILYVGEENE